MNAPRKVDGQTAAAVINRMAAENAALTARVAELEKALTFIQSQAYLGIGEQQPDADQFFRVIEETARVARTGERTK